MQQAFSLAGKDRVGNQITSIKNLLNVLNAQDAKR